MNKHRIARFFLTLFILAGIAGCNMPAVKNLPWLEGLPLQFEQAAPEPGVVATALPPPQETLITFTVQAPPGSPPGETIFLTILDEVTGLALNTQSYPLEGAEAPESADSPPGYSVTLPFAVGSLVKYRYERQADAIRVAEHLSDGSAVRYRMFYVTGQASVEDVVSSWTDTEYSLPTGRIQGQAIDAVTKVPIPNLLVSGGGAQTLTASDGSFMLEGLPPAIHNLVGYAMDGGYRTFQQGARVAEGSTTPTPIELQPAEFSNVVFVVKVPEGTPPVVPLRLAGNLAQLGNTFASLPGGMSSLAGAMPVLSTLPDGRYTVTIPLPAGADIRYKYTLGDGFWNAEHSRDGAFRLRQLIVPEQTVLVEDTVDSWFAGPANSITFDLQIPADTPAGDSLSIQFHPLFGWTEPLPIWKLSDTRWAYVLYSPLNLPGGFSYRYCRNNQCGVADDVQTPAEPAAGRPVEFKDEPQTLSDQVSAWVSWSNGPMAETPPVENVVGRGDGYRSGFELSGGYRPSWDALLPQTFERLHSNGSNLVVLTPTWSYGRSAPGNELPILAPLPGRDAGWSQQVAWVEAAKAQGLNVALRPLANFSIPVDEWWQTASLDESWWQVWFEQYRSFALHYADLAESSGAQTLILGGEWLQPALPGESLPDGSPSGQPADAELRWRNLLDEVRSHYRGQIGWAISYQDVLLAPSFLDLVDRTYLMLPVNAEGSIDETLGQSLETWLDVSAMSFQFLNGKPLILAVSCPADPDLQTQVDCYQRLLTAANLRDWISGFVSLGYYPAAALRDASPSVHGKPAEDLLKAWYPQMIK